MRFFKSIYVYDIQIYMSNFDFCFVSQSEFEKLIVSAFSLHHNSKKKIWKENEKKTVPTAESSKGKGVKTNSCVSESAMIVSDIIGIDEVCKITGLFPQHDL